MSELPLAADFPAIDEDEWRERVARVLKGASFDRLVAKGVDGFEIQPLYPPRHDTTPIARTRPGTVLGRHQGYPFYTIGQRHGLGLALGFPAYVTHIDPETNTIIFNC